MASADWTELTGNLGTTSIDRGVTSGIARPNGGGSFLYGFNSLDTTEGIAGSFCNLVNFAPMAKGGSIRGALQRGVSGGTSNFATFLFIGLQGSDVGSTCYQLGLSDGDTSRIALRKGIISAGLPDQVVTTPTPTNGLLARSDSAVPIATWVHVRLDMIVNLNGDVILNCYQSDLTANLVSAPVWTAIGGLGQIIDDALGINTGSQPLTSGRAGWAFYKKDVTRRGFVDHVELTRQT